MNDANESLHEKMENAWWYRVQELNSNPPDELFHYSNLDALCGIASNRELWATNIEFLNDYAEISYGINLARELTIELAKEDLNAAQRAFIQPFLMGEDIHFGEQLFIVSLSASKDKLSQWRGYGSKEKSVCIGFKTSQIITYGIENPFSTVTLAKVEYDLTEQKKLIFEFFSNYLYGIKDLPENDAIEKHQAKYIGLLMLLAKFKDPSWSEENEWRLIARGLEIIDNVPVRRKRFYRSGKDCIIPYIKINPFKPDYLSTVILPYNAAFKRNGFAIANMLADEKHDLSKIAIIASSIPIIY